MVSNQGRPHGIHPDVVPFLGVTLIPSEPMMEAMGLKKRLECFELPAQTAFPERNPSFECVIFVLRRAK